MLNGFIVQHLYYLGIDITVMPVKWWVSDRITNNKYLHLLANQLGPFGLHTSNCILYRAEIDKIMSKEKPPLSNLEIKLLGPEDWETIKESCEGPGLGVGPCKKSQVALALQNGKVIGHLCSRSGTFFVPQFEREETFEDGFYLFNLRILPNWRRRGVAKFLLMSALEELERKPSIRYAYGYVLTYNLASRLMFESLGFEAVSVTHYLRTFKLRSYQTEMTRASR